MNPETLAKYLYVQLTGKESVYDIEKLIRRYLNAHSGGCGAA